MNIFQTMKKKICWITLCRNEEEIIPFVSQYWSRIADHVVVYDNHSTDSSVELLSKIPNVEIRYFESDGQNEFVQKAIKENAYLEFKDKYDIIIITDMDEIFYFKDNAIFDDFLLGGYAILACNIYSLCESHRPKFNGSQLLHQMAHKFYKQKMNHMQGFEDYSKLSIFNCHVVDKVVMSVGQHYVSTYPVTNIMLVNNGFCLHIDKGLDEEFYVSKRKRMGENLSEINKRFGMACEYLKSEEESRKEYREHQEKSFDLNEII